MVDNGMGEKRQTKIAVSVLRYMPIVPRLQRLFMVEETARQMTWHKTGKRTELDADGNLMIVHTSDGVAWKKFDELHGAIYTSLHGRPLPSAADGKEDTWHPAVLPGS